ncbi:MAG: thioredoxin family protein [Nitriliruptorales bacterium]
MATSTMQLALGTDAPAFSLAEVETGEKVTLDDVAGDRPFVVAFLCRHCPYVKHVEHAFAALAGEYIERGVGFVGISSNDPADYPDDAPDRLAEQKREVGFPFPYLFDETQDVARAYHAACTPDFFAFDAERRLAYRGRMDPSRPDQGEPTGADLRAALDALLEGGTPSEDQWPSMGCSIKWRAA